MEIEDEGVFANAGDEVGDVLGEDDIDVVASLKEERKGRKMAASSVKCESKAEGWPYRVSIEDIKHCLEPTPHVCIDQFTDVRFLFDVYAEIVVVQ